MKDKIIGFFALIFLIALFVVPTWYFFKTVGNDRQKQIAPNTTLDSEPTPNPDGYAVCADAHDEGVYNIPEGDPAYKERQDADQDGYACEPYIR